MHDFGAFQQGSFDTSHIIHHLSFGDDLPDEKVSFASKYINNPLDNTEHISKVAGSAIFQYYTKVVPTRFTKINGNTHYTNQYSVTKHETELKLKDGFGIPGYVSFLFFIFIFFFPKKCKICLLT